MFCLIRKFLNEATKSLSISYRTMNELASIARPPVLCRPSTAPVCQVKLNYLFIYFLFCKSLTKS